MTQSNLDVHPRFGAQVEKIFWAWMERSDRAREYDRMLSAGLLTINEVRTLLGRGAD
jgi:hypothetical protein